MASEIGRVLPGDLPTFIAGAPRSKDTGQVFLFQDIEDQKWVCKVPDIEPIELVLACLCQVYILYYS